MLNFKDNFPLKNVTTLDIGGPAKKFVVVKTDKELTTAIEYANTNSFKYLIIGGGSNLLVADEGFDGLVIKNEIIGIAKEGDLLKVKSGTKLQDLVNYTIQNGISGLQKLNGIPGTVGGAVCGNAGAYGQTISDYIISVDKLSNSDCKFGYRSSIFKQTKHPILEITFRLQTTDPEILKKEAADILSKRLIKYPEGIKCPGSFFKNLVASQIPAEVLKNVPQDTIIYGKIPAGALLEEVGAKGQCSDGIEIASYHANLFLNNGSGTAKAFYDLAKNYAQKVKEKFGITLEPEVQFINLPPL